MGINTTYDFSNATFVEPFDADVVAVSSDTDVISVTDVMVDNSDGSVRLVLDSGASEGTATITLTGSKTGYNSATTSFVVTVNLPEVEIGGLNDDVRIRVGDSENIAPLPGLEAQIYPPNATVIATSSDTGIVAITSASVESGGIISIIAEGVSRGEAVVTVTASASGYTSVTRTINVEVRT